MSKRPGSKPNTSSSKSQPRQPTMGHTSSTKPPHSTSQTNSSSTTPNSSSSNHSAGHPNNISTQSATTTTTTNTTTTNTASTTTLQTTPPTTTGSDLPFGAYRTWAEYRAHMLTLMDLEYGLQKQLSPKNSFSVDWSISQHLLTEQMNLIATIIIPYTNNYIPVDNLKLGDRLQFLHPTATQFNLQNKIPITGFIDNIIPENDLQHYSIDIIIDTISTAYLRSPSLSLPTLSQINSAPSASPLSSPLHATLLAKPLSQEGFLKVFLSIDFPPHGYQIILHTPSTLNYHRVYYNLYTMKLPQHLENCILGQYSPISNHLEAIGFRPEAIPSKHDIVRKDVIHATTTIPSIFDQQQVDTLHYAIQQPFCVIRAPPGCGKTEMISTAGLKIQAILKRQYVAHQLEEEDYTPVLVTGANEVSLFNEVGKYIFTRSDEVLVISNTFSSKWLHDPVLRPTLLQSVIATWIYDHPDDLLNNFMQRIFPDYGTYNQRQRYILALKLHLIINDDRFMLNLAIPGIENHYIDPNTDAGDTGFKSSVNPVPYHKVPGIDIPQSVVHANNSLEHIVNFDTIKPILLFNPYHFFERLSLLFSQDENDVFENQRNDEDEDEDDNEEENDENIFNPEITPLSLQDTLLFCEHYHDLQLDLIRNSNIVCCANELAGNKLLFHGLKFHHVLMDDTHSVIEATTLLPLNYGAKQALLSYDNALLRPTTPFTPGPKQHRFCRPLAERLLTLNDWKSLKPLPPNANNIQTVRIVPSAHCNVQYRVHPRLFEFPYQNHYKITYPNLLNQLTLPRDVHSKNYDVLFASVYKRDIVDKHSDCPRVFGAKYFDWAVRRLEADRAGMYNRSLEKFPWPNDQLPFLFLSTSNPTFEAQLKSQGIVDNTTNPQEAQYADCLLAHFVHLGLNLDDLGIIVPFQDQIDLMFKSFATPKSALTQALYERRLLQKNDNKINLQVYFRSKLKIALPDHFQSVDCKILIFSTTRTQSKTLGPILSNPSVINLAMTRARNAVMFLGDHNILLQQSVSWTKLILYAADNNALMLPTMAKRFVPWLATSRAFIYEMNRRKKEMILHQFLPQLLAQSVSSPPTSKDPIESKAFKLQLVEFEEFDVLLQYYRQLLGDRNEAIVNHTSELDLYDDGFNPQQDHSNFYSFSNDETIFSSSIKAQTQGLAVHFQPTVPKTVVPVTNTTATTTTTPSPTITTAPRNVAPQAVTTTVTPTTTTTTQPIVAPVEKALATTKPVTDIVPEATKVTTSHIEPENDNIIAPSSSSPIIPTTTSSPPAPDTTTMTAAAPSPVSINTSSTQNTQQQQQLMKNPNHLHPNPHTRQPHIPVTLSSPILPPQQPQQSHHYPSNNTTALSSASSYASSSATDDNMVTMIPISMGPLNPINQSLLHSVDPMLSNMGDSILMMHQGPGLGSPLVMPPHSSHSGLISPTGFPLHTSPMMPHQLSLSASAVSATSPQSTHSSIHNQHGQLQQLQAQQQGFVTTTPPVATSPNLFVGPSGLDFQGYHNMVYPAMHPTDSSSPHIGGVGQDEQGDMMGQNGNVFMDPQLGAYSPFLMHSGMYPPPPHPQQLQSSLATQQQQANQQIQGTQPQQNTQVTQSTQATLNNNTQSTSQSQSNQATSQQNSQQQSQQSQKQQSGAGSTPMGAMMSNNNPIPVNLGVVSQNATPFFPMQPNNMMPNQSQMAAMAAAAQMNFGGMFPPNQMMGPHGQGNPLMSQSFNNPLYPPTHAQFMSGMAPPMPGMNPAMMNSPMGLMPPPQGPNGNFNPNNQGFFGAQPPGMQFYPPNNAQFGFPQQGMMGPNGYVGMMPQQQPQGVGDSFTVPNPAPVQTNAIQPPPPAGN